MKKRCSDALKNFFRCSALTLALFLAYFCDDPAAFRTELKEVFENSLATAGSIQ